MSRLKTFAKYILWLVLFYIFSNIIIFFGVSTTYENISLKNSLPEQVSISSAQATLINGNVKGSISNTDNISDKYLKFSFYSDTGSLTGIYCLKISNLDNNQFEFYFKLHYVDSYSVEIVDVAENTEQYEEHFSLEQYRKYKLAYYFLLLMFI